MITHEMRRHFIPFPRRMIYNINIIMPQKVDRPMNVDSTQLIGMVITIIIFAAIGIWSGKKIKTKADYYIAGQSFGAAAVAGSTAGMDVGGGAVIGTAQLAFTDGFSGFYFSLGCLIAITVMGVKFSVPVRHSGCQTIQEMVTVEFGKTAGLLATLFGIFGFYINNIAHFLSGISLIGSLFPLSTLVSSLITGALILVCVFLGGFWGLSLINELKTLILFVTVLVSAIAIAVATNGFSDMAGALPDNFLALFPRGAGTDLGNLLSVSLGIMSTQSTIQTIFSARSDRDSRIGSVVGACVLPIVGLCCVVIGMFMRMAHPEIDSLQAFPQFILMYTDGIVSGVILATTLIAVASAGVSVMLGIAGILVNNIYLRLRPQADTKRQLLFSRLIIVALLTLTTIIINSGASSAIMQYNFLSMGMRCCVLFLPMCAALFLPGKISPRFAIASIVLGPISLLVGKLALTLPFDCIFLAMAVCGVLMILGFFDQKRARRLF